MITADDIKNLRIPVLTTPANIDLATTIARIINFLLVIVGIIAFIYLIYSGILYITAAGSPDQAKKAQQGVISVVVGLIVVALSYAIIKFAISFAQQIGG
jgi:threonine/homoserine/homoserine lactone efflux protein